MNINEFTKLIKDLYDESDSFEMTPETDFRTIETYDSLTGWTIMSEILDKFGIEIKPEEFANLHTVKEIFDFVEDKKKK